MGEHTPDRLVRAIGVAAVLGAAVLLSSCSALTGPGDAPTDSGPVLDPSVPSATPTETATVDAPTPTDSAAAPTSSAAPSDDARAAVVPFITIADWDAETKTLEVAAVVPKIIESGGTCTVTATLGGTTRTTSSTGVGTSSYTGCPGVDLDGLAAGTWHVRVRYESAKSAGSSADRAVQVG